MQVKPIDFDTKATRRPAPSLRHIPLQSPLGSLRARIQTKKALLVYPSTPPPALKPHPSLHLHLLRRRRRLPARLLLLRRLRRGLHLGPLQALPLAVAGGHETTGTGGAGVVAAAAALTLGGQAALAVLAAVDDVLQALALAWLRDLGPVQVLAGLGVVGDVGHGRGGDLALAAGAGAGVEVGGGVDFGAGRLVLDGGLGGVVVWLRS